MVLLAGLVMAIAATEAEWKGALEPELDPVSRAAVRNGEWLQLSAVSGAAGSPETEPGAAARQTLRAIQKAENTLRAAGMDLSRVVSVNLYLSDIRHFSEINREYRKHFSAIKPVRTTVEADLADPDSLLQLSMIAVNSDVEIESIAPQSWKPPQSPYSWAIHAGETVFIAGMVSEDPATATLVAGDVASQTRKSLENLGELLKAAGLDYRNVDSCRVYLAESRHFREMNQVYRTFFPEDPPVRATVRARLASPDLKVEIQCVASATKEREALGEVNSALPFSAAIKSGDRIFVSGMVGRGPDGYPEGDVSAQTELTLERIASTLRSAGVGPSHATESVVFVSDIRTLEQVDGVYRRYFPNDPPARTVVGMELMAAEALVEIMVTARLEGEGE